MNLTEEELVDTFYRDKRKIANILYELFDSCYRVQVVFSDLKGEVRTNYTMAQYTSDSPSLCNKHIEKVHMEYSLISHIDNMFLFDVTLEEAVCNYLKTTQKNIRLTKTGIITIYTSMGSSITGERYANIEGKAFYITDILPTLELTLQKHRQIITKKGSYPKPGD